MAALSTWSTAGGSPGRREVTAGGGSVRCAVISPSWVSFRNGRVPASSSNAAQAREYWSARPSMRWLSICSGAM